MGGKPEVKFAGNAKPADVSTYSLGVLTDILSIAGLHSCVISSTARSPRKQAAAMYVNLEERGVEAEKKLYLAPGRAVIRVYEDCLASYCSTDETITAMEAKIIELGPSTVSHHCADPARCNVFDVAPSSVQAKLISFERAARADKRVTTFLAPPKDAGFHFEIPQPQQVST